ncbi:MAG: CAP domain-containing protein, partial [Ktedonobacteraceae bacterium]
MKNLDPVNKKLWFLPVLCVLISLVAACAQSSQSSSVSTTFNSSQVFSTTSAPGLVILQQVASPTSVAGFHGSPPTDIPASGVGPAPYGPAPTPSALDVQLTQQLFNLINQDRATRGLPPFTWNATLEGGARLHSWNMYHCGFSHT